VTPQVLPLDRARFERKAWYLVAVAVGMSAIPLVGTSGTVELGIKGSSVLCMPAKSMGRRNGQVTQEALLCAFGPVHLANKNMLFYVAD
jgi:threonine/homoserine efflux transporter RhtA